VAGSVKAIGSWWAFSPRLVRHLVARGIEPGDVLDVRSADRATSEPLASLQYRLLVADADVPFVERQILAGVTEPVAEEFVSPAQVPADRARVRIEDQLVRIESMTRGRLVRPVDPVAVELAGEDVGQIRVPDVVRPLAKGDSLRLLRRLHGVEQA
jgi:hypothetical protein